jgi:hypothetical protein
MLVRALASPLKGGQFRIVTNISMTQPERILA